MLEIPEFKGFPKIPRLYRQAVWSEKLDGTNAAVGIVEYSFGTWVDGTPGMMKYVMGNPLPVDHPQYDGLPDKEYLVYAQSRNRLISPADDNHGFARWVWDNAEKLIELLGPGLHSGEWWGSGIYRGYGLTKGEKRFSLFNTGKWNRAIVRSEAENTVPWLDVVPVVYQGIFSTEITDALKDTLRTNGSYAAPEFMRPEGIVIYHVAANSYFKTLLEGDDTPKGE